METKTTARDATGTRRRAGRLAGLELVARKEDEAGRNSEPPEMEGSFEAAVSRRGLTGKRIAGPCKAGQDLGGG